MSVLGVREPGLCMWMSDQDSESGQNDYFLSSSLGVGWSLRISFPLKGAAGLLSATRLPAA